MQGKLSAGGGRAEQLAQDTKRSEAEKVTELYYWTFPGRPRTRN